MIKRAFRVFWVILLVVNLAVPIQAHNAKSGETFSTLGANLITNYQNPNGSLISDQMPPELNGTSFPDHLSPDIGDYDRDAACAYAVKYVYKQCSDINPPASFNPSIYSGYSDCAHFVSCAIGNEINDRGGGLSLGYHTSSAYSCYHYGFLGAKDSAGWELIPVLKSQGLIVKLSSVGNGSNPSYAVSPAMLSASIPAGLQKGDLIRFKWNVNSPAYGHFHLVIYLKDYPVSGQSSNNKIASHSDNNPPAGSYLGDLIAYYQSRYNEGNKAYEIEFFHILNKSERPSWPSSPKFQKGDSVKATEDQFNVRVGPGAGTNYSNQVFKDKDYNVLFKAPLGATGQILEGPATLDGTYTWYKVQWQSGVVGTGWCPQDFLTAISPQASWVFLYYMSNGNDSRLEDSITEKFKQVAQGCANPNVKAYFLWDHFSGQDGVYSMTTNQDWTTYKEGVNFWPPPLAGISSQWELNMGDPATLKNFILWVLGREGANRNYALVICDHGSGIYSEAEIRREEPSGICFEGSDYLSVKELGDAVGYFANLNHRPIGVLHLDACLMQMMEVNYQLRSSCDYLVASENEGWSGCYEYYYLSTVQSNSQPRELAEKIALAYFGWLIDNDRPGTVSVTKPGETNRVLNAINGFSIALWNNMDKLRALDGVIRDQVQKFAYPNIYNTDDTNNWFVDLEDFCYEIKEHVGDAQLANQAQAVLDALGIPGGNFILLERHRSKNYYDTVEKKMKYRNFEKGTYGISILLPPSSANPSHYTSENFEFCRDSYWDEFIKAYTSAARLKLTAPEGGTWKVGEVCPITWTYANLSGYLSIQLSRDGGNTYSEPIADSVPVVNGRWDWTVTGSASSSCKIRIQSLSYSYICDISDQIFSISAPSNPIISLTPSSLSFTCLQGSSPPSQTLQIRNSGGGTLNWTVSDNATWLTVNPASGSSTGEWDPVTVSVNASSLSPGPYTAKITVSAPEASNSPQYVPVSLTVASSNLPSPIVESNIPQSGTVNQPLTFSISLTNLGGTAEHGGISVSFPELDQISSTSMPPYSSTKGDVIATSTQGLTVSYYDKGDAISKYPPGSGSIPAQHLLVEATYGSWGNGVSKVLNFTLTPKVEGTYRIRFRGWLTTSGYSNYYGDPNSGIVDQQGYFVYESQIRVTSVPKGTISVQANITAPFTLNGPNSLVLTGTTPWQRSDLDPGNYTVNWGSVSGYISPPSETKTLPSGGSITFMGNYTLIPQNGTWTNMNPTAFPSARYMHAMTYDTSRKKVVLFGGFSETEGYLNDLWSYSFSSNSWSKLNATNPPPGRVSPAIAYDPTKDRIIIFGGGSPGIDLDDTWAYYYSTGRWEKLNPSTHPSPRSDAQMVYDSSTQKIILFGGHGSVLFGDTWAFDCQTDNWVNLLPLNGPTARYDFGMAYDSVRHRVIIFGGLTGWDYNSAKNDTWAYDPSTNSWSNLNPSSPPSARANHALSFDSLNDKIILFGGFQNTFLNETWAYNPATNSWIKLSPEGPLPPARGYFPMAYDSAYNRTVLFGGYNGQLLSDTWTFNIGGTPSRFTLNYTVTPSGSGSVTLNPPPDADGKYASGTNVILTANPNSGFTFSHWSGSVSGTANPINVIMNEDKQVTANFVPMISQPTISGRVTRADNSQGLDGVTITFSNGGGSVTTSGGGYYSRQVPNGWSGRATPSYSGGGSFNPTFRDYTNVTSDQANQNYTWNPPPNPVLSITPTYLAFSWELGSNPPSSQKIVVSNSGGGTLSWSAQINYGQGFGWLSVNPPSDTSNNREVTVSVTPSGLTQGNYRGYITFIGASGTGNSPQIVTVDLAVSVPHTVSITNGPNATPNPVDPKGVVQLSVNAQDSWGHQLQYQWSVVSSSIGGGTFTNPNSAQTQWTAPDNQTDKDETVRIRIAVSCSINPALSDERFIDVVVRRKTPIQILGGPSANPNPVDSGGTTKLIVNAKDLESSFPLTYSWTEESSELGDPGRFSTPNDFATDWTAPANLSESDKRVTIKVRIARSTDPSIFVERTVNVIVQPELPYQYYGELQATDFRSVMNQNAYADTLTFKVNSPTTVRIDMFSQFDNYLYLYKGPIPSAGNLIAQNDNYFGTNASLNKVFVSPGVYSIEASSYHSLMTGPYRLASSVELVPHVQITNGPTATPSIVPSEGSVSLSVEAKDIADDHLTYSWEVVESSIGSGSFSDPNIQNPTWIAPPNPGSDARVKIKVRVACWFRPDIDYAEGLVEVVVKGSIPPILSLSPPSFTFTATQGGANPPPQTLEVWNSGRGSMNWTASKNASWLTLSPTWGSSSGEHDQITVSVNISGLASGTFSATITLTGEGAPNSPQYIPVTLQVNPPPNIEIQSLTATPSVDVATFNPLLLQATSPAPGNWSVRVFNSLGMEVTSYGSLVFHTTNPTTNFSCSWTPTLSYQIPGNHYALISLSDGAQTRSATVSFSLYNFPVKITEVKLFNALWQEITNPKANQPFYIQVTIANWSPYGPLIPKAFIPIQITGSGSSTLGITFSLNLAPGGTAGGGAQFKLSAGNYDLMIFVWDDSGGAPISLPLKRSLQVVP